MISSNFISIFIIFPKLLICFLSFTFPLLIFDSTKILTEQYFIDKCGIERKILKTIDDDNWNHSFGKITNIENNTRFCEWLITTNKPSDSKFINLNFLWINFSCNTDIIYIFDGESFEDKLIASINGPSALRIEPVFASSGSLFIFYYTESIDILSTFSLEYSFTDCPLNCSRQGVCHKNRCICNKNRNGIACQFELCSNNCSQSGNCLPTSIKNEQICLNTETDYFCDCLPNFIGQSCNVNLIENNKHTFGWIKLFANEQIFSARTSHALVYDPLSDKIYIYGGRNYEAIFSDLLSYSISTNKWFNLTNCDIKTSNLNSAQPKSLWGHTMNLVNNSLILFGGISKDGLISNELWVYNLNKNNWTKKDPDGVVIPGLAFHIAVIVDLEWLYIHGGRLQYSTYSSDIYRINILDGLQKWQLIKPVNSKPYHRQLAAHTAIFYDHLRSIVLFGGISYSNGGEKLRNEIHLYNVDKNTWSTLNYHLENYIPSKRAFHSMVLFENYLLIFGGFIETKEHQRSNSDSKEIKCRDNRLYIYCLTCHEWVDFSDIFKFNIARFPFDGLFSHSMVRRQNFLFVFGGYFNQVRNDILAFVLPTTNLTTLLFNHSYMNFGSKTNSKTVKTCQGLCPRLNDCFVCLAYGYNDNVNSIGSCMWDVQNHECINYSSTDDIANEHFITEQHYCKDYNNFRIESGLTLLKYYNVPNFSYPDEVSIIPELSNFQTSFQEEWISKKYDAYGDKHKCTNLNSYDNTSSMFNMARILGFIHPLGAQTYENNSIRIYLRSTSPEAILFSSSNYSSHSTIKSIPSNVTPTIYNSYVDMPFDGFSNNFFIDFIIKFPIRTVMDKLDYERIDITWKTISSNSTTDSLLDLVLMPFNDENLCHLQSNCNACLSNMACAWCSLNNQCIIHRRITLSGCFDDFNNNSFSSIIVEPSECLYCFEAVNCAQCVLNPNCEWLHTYEVCVRRGRFNNDNSTIIRSNQSCPLECHQKDSPETCLDGSNNCIWCKSTNQCLHFSSTTYNPSSLFEFCIVNHHQINSRYIQNCTNDISIEFHSITKVKRLQANSLIYNDTNDTKCPSGYFGNATSSNTGCQLCECNGHGNRSKGVCHHQTGVCFCQDYTEGTHCDRCIPGYYGNPKEGGVCFLECQNKILISNATFGHFGFYIRDIHFPKNQSYSRKHALISTIANIHCLWIFTTSSLSFENTQNLSVEDPLNSLMTQIQITIFRSMNLNCSHSTLIIYDGIPDLIPSVYSNHAINKSSNRILASICGSEKVQDIKLLAYSGFATVLFITDNLHQSFNGSYQAVIANQSKMLSINDNTFNVKWPQNFHTLEYYGDHLIFTGGHLHTEYLDLTLFSLKYRRWIVPHSQSNKQSKPSNRQLHASTLIDNKLYIYGGLDLGSNQVLNEFWCAFIINQDDSLDFVWINLTAYTNNSITMNNHLRMPSLVGHTLTPIKFDGQQDAILLLGGFSPDDGFSHNYYIYIPKLNQWKLMFTHGPSPIGIVAHTSVYHRETNMLYMFGGIDFKESHKMAISNTLYTLDCKTKVWHRIQPKSVMNSITPVYFHMAASFQNYMLIFGGKKTMHFGIDDTNESPAFAYFYKCNRWTPLYNVSFWNDSTFLLSNREFYFKKSSSVTHNDTVYLYGTISSTLWSISMKKLYADICNFYSNNRTQCLNMEGCAYCILSHNGTSLCYDNSEVSKNCLIETISIRDNKCLPQKDCDQYTNCADCTAANYEIRDDGGCQWCADCHLVNGQCIKMNDTCQWDSDIITSSGTLCNNISLVEMANCHTHRCLATDCRKCLLFNENHQNECVWTKQVYKFIRFSLSISANPIFDWACIESSIVKFSLIKNVPTIPPLDCPIRCNLHHTCSSCLEYTTGDESGSHECVWSEVTQECMSPTYTLLKCHHGLCGGFTYRQMHSKQCPQECETLEKANDCLSMLHCGWCAVDDLPIDGVGICLKGNFFGPFDQTCSNQSDDLLSQLNQKFYVPITSLTTKWYYLHNPKENECLNGHHTCDKVSQNCIDLDEGFMCRCKTGYKMFGNICKPICHQGCIHGICISPNICRCHFGFIGEDCSIECHCHGHSTCPSVDRTNECIKCHNNTQGTWCEQCNPFFVGNPSTSSSPCQPCYQYCHNHSELCFSEEHLANLTSSEMTKLDDDHWYEFGLKMKHGPPNDKTVVCVNCKNNTEGQRCDRCKLGFFKISDDIRDGCRRCMCNGHGSLCNPFNGENCNCNNNTENDRQCNYMNSKEYSNYINKTYFFKSSQITTTYSLPCWMLQCSKCKDYFYGTPTNGHQCYRHMYIDKEYCLDPYTQENCSHKPHPLFHGRTVFFGLQPRYMNVDMRLIVFSIEGRIDLYLSSKDDMFIVKVDPINGFQHVSIDDKYIHHDQNISMSLKKNETASEELQDIDFTNLTLRSPYNLIVQNLNEQISSYYTMDNWYEIVLLQNVSNRLEITIPYRSQDLRTTRYYIIIRGNYLYDSNSNQGLIVLRQDQSRIDLFVFFCVFLSCFFIFLCFSIMFWRMKRIIDLNRARHQHEIELELMAKRPFITITVLLDEESAFQKVSFICQSIQSTPSKKVSFLRHLATGYKESPKIYPENQIMRAYEQRNCNKTPMPISIEPTDDGLAAIFTTFIELPSEDSARIRIAAASSLVSIKSCPLILQKLNKNK